MKKKVFFPLKCVFSLGLLGFLFVSADMRQLGSGLLEVDLYYFSAALVVGIVAVVVSVYKWQALLAAGGINCHFWPLVRYYLIGIYFNNFLPTSLGGDAARIYLLSKKCGSHLLIALSVLLERLSGVIVLVLFLLIGVLIGPQFLEAGENFLVISLCCLVLFCSALLLFSTVRVWLQRLLPRSVGDKLALLVEGSAIDFHNRKTSWKIVCSSLLFQLLSIFIYVLVARALTIPLSFLDLLAVVPLVTLLTLLPVSLNGLGLREGGFVLLLARLQVSSTDALSLSLLFYSITVILSIAGGILFLIHKFEYSRILKFEKDHD